MLNINTSYYSYYNNMVWYCCINVQYNYRFLDFKWDMCVFKI